MIGYRRILSCLLILCGVGMGWNAVVANNVRIGEISSDGQTVELSVAWDNAWNLSTGPANHDAVWLFLKIQRSGKWEHLHLAAHASAHVALEAGRLTIAPDPDGLGLMLQTAWVGSGPIPETHLRIQLAEPILAGEFDIAAFGIEMAWVPEEPYWLGDGASNFCLRDTLTGQPYLVGSESEIPAGTLHATGDNPPGGAIPATYPKGYAGFYLMKYELSQAQYADFLDLLPEAQQAAHYAASALGTNRNGLAVLHLSNTFETEVHVVCNATPDDQVDAYNDGQNRACNWLSWADLSAYLDWAALRPITELEFEKACRGPLAPRALEFAWGTDSIVDANSILADGEATEGVAETATTGAGLGSHGYAGPQGPLRCGFGAHGSSDRLQAGAGYYGHLELSGNLWELCVTTRAAALGYDGATGDGTLSPTGQADVPTWPTASGVGYKGGGWNSGVIPGFRDLAVSDRFYIGLASDTRRATAGGRGGR